MYGAPFFIAYFATDLEPEVHDAFRDFLEVSLDVDNPSSEVHLVAFQNVKRGISYGDPIEVVVHSTCGVQWQDPIDAALNGISRLNLGILYVCADSFVFSCFLSCFLIKGMTIM